MNDEDFCYCHNDDTDEYHDCLTRGKCFYGDPDYFYRNKIIAWREVDWNLLLSFSHWCDKSGINYEYIDALPEKIVDMFLSE